MNGKDEDAGAVTRRPQTERHKTSIRVGLLLRRLQDFAEGKIEMSRGQLASAEAVLAWLLPDLALDVVAVEAGDASRILENFRKHVVAAVFADEEIFHRVFQRAITEIATGRSSS